MNGLIITTIITTPNDVGWFVGWSLRYANYSEQDVHNAMNRNNNCKAGSNDPLLYAHYVPQWWPMIYAYGLCDSILCFQMFVIWLILLYIVTTLHYTKYAIMKLWRLLPLWIRRRTWQDIIELNNRIPLPFWTEPSSLKIFGEKRWNGLHILEIYQPLVAAALRILTCLRFSSTSTAYCVASLARSTLLIAR